MCLYFRTLSYFCFHLVEIFLVLLLCTLVVAQLLLFRADPSFREAAHIPSFAILVVDQIVPTGRVGTNLRVILLHFVEMLLAAKKVSATISECPTWFGIFLVFLALLSSRYPCSALVEIVLKFLRLPLPIFNLPFLWGSASSLKLYFLFCGDCLYYWRIIPLHHEKLALQQSFTSPSYGEDTSSHRSILS